MKKNIQVLYLMLISVFLMECTKKENLYPYYGPVTVTQAFAVSNSLPNFTIGDKVYFTGKFEQNTNWTIQLVGQTSNAVKTITGTGTELNASNSTWDGSSNVPPSFRSETVTATLSFNGDSKTYSVNLSVTGPKKTETKDFLITDFTNNIPTLYTTASTNPLGWIKDWPAITTANNTFTKPNGNNYMFMKGYPWGDVEFKPKHPINPYINFLKIPAKYYKSGGPYSEYFPLPPQPSRVFFNLLVCNTGTKYSRLEIRINEQGLEGEVSRVINVVPDWPVGTWKLLSYNYGELTGYVGDASKITSVQFTLISTAPQDILDLRVTDPTNTLTGKYDISVAFDNPIFTMDAPWQP